MSSLILGFHLLDLKSNDDNGNKRPSSTPGLSLILSQGQGLRRHLGASPGLRMPVGAIHGPGAGRMVWLPLTRDGGFLCLLP